MICITIWYEKVNYTEEALYKLSVQIIRQTNKFIARIIACDLHHVRNVLAWNFPRIPIHSLEEKHFYIFTSFCLCKKKKKIDEYGVWAGFHVPRLIPRDTSHQQQAPDNSVQGRITSCFLSPLGLEPETS